MSNEILDGSPLSRALARMLATSREAQLSQADRDALTIYGSAFLIDATMQPDYSDSKVQLRIGGVKSCSGNWAERRSLWRDLWRSGSWLC